MAKLAQILSFIVTGFIAVGLSACSVVAESSSISTYEECVAAGNKVLRSYPAKCVAGDGQVFIEPVLDKTVPLLEEPLVGNSCVDRCGNGQCDMIVCMAIGCPCAESSENCPKDCP